MWNGFVRTLFRASKTFPTIFNTISVSDKLSLFKGRAYLLQSIQRYFSGGTKEDISIASGVSFGSVCFDKKIAVELTERITEWATTIALAHRFLRTLNKTML